MERSIKYRVWVWFMLAGLLAGCTESPVPPDPLEQLSEKELQLIGQWRYVQVEVKGLIFELADARMEPGFNKADLGGERAEVDKRRIFYAPEKTYQLRWSDRGNYTLGTEGRDNWQPNFGYWHLNENEDSLFHNYGTPAMTGYAISFSGNDFRRTSRRVMSSSLVNNGIIYWEEGDVVTYTEVFRKE